MILFLHGRDGKCICLNYLHTICITDRCNLIFELAFLIKSIFLKKVGDSCSKLSCFTENFRKEFEVVRLYWLKSMKVCFHEF